MPLTDNSRENKRWREKTGASPETARGEKLKKGEGEAGRETGTASRKEILINEAIVSVVETRREATATRIERGLDRWWIGEGAFPRWGG